MEHLPPAWLIALLLFAGMLLCLDCGRRIGVRRLRDDPDGVRSGTSAIESSIFALLGLMIAFTFAGGASRFDTRREQIVREANAIGTAWLRLDLLAAEAQAPLREQFRRYVDARLLFCDALPDIAAARVAEARCKDLQGAIWSAALAGCRAQTSPAPSTLLLSALNEMIDITTMRSAAMLTHPPALVYFMLFIIALGASLLAGHGMASTRRSWLHMVCLAAATAITVFVILDLEFPRHGFIRIDEWDRLLVEVRQSMK
jgi:hypothetical protein